MQKISKIGYKSDNRRISMLQSLPKTAKEDTIDDDSNTETEGKTVEVIIVNLKNNLFCISVQVIGTLWCCKVLLLMKGQVITFLFSRMQSLDKDFKLLGDCSLLSKHVVIMISLLENYLGKKTIIC